MEKCNNVKRKLNMFEEATASSCASKEVFKLKWTDDDVRVILL